MFARNFACCAALACAVIPSSARAESSNQRDVRSSLERDGWRVAYGKMITEAEYVGTAASIVASVYLRNPAPFQEYMRQVMMENYNKIRDQIGNLAFEDMVRLLDQAVRERRIQQINNLQLDAGFATYERWQEYTHPSVDTSSWPWRYRDVTEKMPLPNWHQFYVRYRIIGPPPTGGGINPPSVAPAEYTFVGPNTRTGGMPGTYTERFIFRGNGRWESFSTTRWNDGSVDPTMRHVYQESARQPGRVVLNSQEGLVPVALQDDGKFIWRDWPGDGYPYAPPNIIRWWRCPGDGQWLTSRP